MAKFSNTEYIDSEMSLVLSNAWRLFKDEKWTILETTESSISAREGLVGFLTSGPVTMTINASTVQPGQSNPPGGETYPRDGSTRVDSDLSCLGVGPINKNRLKRIEDKIIGLIIIYIAAEDIRKNDSESYEQMIDESQKKKFCKSCNQQLNDDAVFCGLCGTAA